MAQNLAKMMKEAQKLEKRLGEVRKRLEEMTVEGSSGGGAVRVTMNGQRDVLKVSVDPSVLEDGVLDAWFAELGIDPELPPISEGQTPEPTS